MGGCLPNSDVVMAQLLYHVQTLMFEIDGAIVCNIWVNRNRWTNSVMLLFWIGRGTSKLLGDTAD